jgi:hypothetical protein
MLSTKTTNNICKKEGIRVFTNPVIYMFIWIFVLTICHDEYYNILNILLEGIFSHVSCETKSWNIWNIINIENICKLLDCRISMGYGIILFFIFLLVGLRLGCIPKISFLGSLEVLGRSCGVGCLWLIANFVIYFICLKL